MAASCLFFVATSAHALLIVKVIESGPDVIVSQTGSLDFSGASSISELDGWTPQHRQINGSTADGSTVAFNSYAEDSKFVTFNGQGVPDSGAMTVGVQDWWTSTSPSESIGLVAESYIHVFVPRSSSSGSAISASYTIPGESFASLGLVAGETAVWNLANGDSVTWLVAIPEPTSAVLIGLGLAGLARSRHRRN